MLHRSTKLQVASSLLAVGLAGSVGCGKNDSGISQRADAGNLGADATADGLEASVVPRIIREDDISLTTRDTDSFYHIGYNCRQAPMTDPNFRRAVARHIDRETTVSDSLDGYGVPSEAPLEGRWTPEDLRWDGEASLPFFGTDGALDAEAAREAFQEAGYQYEDEELVRRTTS